MWNPIRAWYRFRIRAARKSHEFAELEHGRIGQYLRESARDRIDRYAKKLGITFAEAWHI